LAAAVLAREGLRARVGAWPAKRKTGTSRAGSARRKHPVQPPVEEQADFLKCPKRLLAFLVAALHIVLVGPSSALEQVAEQPSQHAG
jgi:hypothetical protein